MGKFRAEIKNLQTFKSLIEFLSEIREDVYFTFVPDGIRFKTQDYSRTSLVQGLIKEQMFNGMEGDAPEGFALCFSVKDMTKWLKRIKEDEAVSLEVEEVELRLISPKRKFQLQAMEAEDLKDLPEFTKTFEVNFEANLEELYEKTQDIAMANQSFILETTPEGLLFRCPLFATLKKVWSILSVPGLPQNVKSGFGVLFYEPLKALFGEVEKVNVNFGNEAPMILDIVTDCYSLKYIFAPRLETEE